MKIVFMKNCQLIVRLSSSLLAGILSADEAKCEAILAERDGRLVVEVTFRNLNADQILRSIPLRGSLGSKNGVISKPPSISVESTLLVNDEDLFILIKIDNRVLVNKYSLTGIGGWNAPLEVTLSTDTAAVALLEKKEKIMLKIEKTSGENKFLELNENSDFLKKFDDSPGVISGPLIFEANIQKDLMEILENSKENP